MSSQSDERKVPVAEKAWAAHLEAAEESEVEPHPKAEARASRGG